MGRYSKSAVTLQAPRSLNLTFSSVMNFVGHEYQREKLWPSLNEDTDGASEEGEDSG